MAWWKSLRLRLGTRGAQAPGSGLSTPPATGLGRGGWWPIVRESYPGAWQQNVTVLNTESVLTHAAVYACVTLIASDIGKLRVKLVAQNGDGIWEETKNTAHSPILRKPNRYQNRIKFYEQWIVSKLIHGNTYAVKQRDQRGVVSALYILDPTCVRPLVAPDGQVYYSLSRDLLSQIENSIVVPQSEIIHDVMVPLYHPLVGVSPIYACAVSSAQGITIQKNQATLFAKGSVPSGIVTAPGHIPQELADEMKARWNEAYSGENYGQVAVLGDGLTYEKMSMSAVDAQLIDQLKWSAENACTAFHVPPYLVGVGPVPPNSSVEQLQIQYYSQCLQNLIECIEILLDEGLEMSTNDAGQPIGTEMDLDDLIRMDTTTKVKAAADAIKGGGMAPNEARARYLDLGPVAGGDSPYLQQQNFSLEALAKRDAQPDPFHPAPPPAPPPPAPADGAPVDAPPDDTQAAGAGAWLTRYFAARLTAAPRELPR
jgi:HK97 family phage portal protein